MKIEYMREFLELCNTLNYTTAASNLFTTQSTLTRHIQSMEQELGVKLVMTTTHGVEITEYGKNAEKYYAKITREYDDFIEKNSNISSRVSGVLHIGMLYYAMEEFYAEFLNHLHRKYPSIELDVNGYMPHKLVEDLKNSKVDIASLFYYKKQVDKDMVMIDVGKQPVVIMLDENNPFASSEYVVLSELDDFPLIILKRDEYSDLVTKSIIKDCKAKFTDYLLADNIEMVPIVIRSSGGIHISGESCNRQKATGIAYKVLVSKSGKICTNTMTIAALKGNENPLVKLVMEEARIFFDSAMM